MAALVIAAPSSFAASAGSLTALRGISLSDPNPPNVDDKFVVKLETSVGTFSLPLTGSLSGFPPTVSATVSVVGTLSEVNAQLATISFTDPTADTGSIHISVIGFQIDPQGTLIFPSSETFIPMTVAAVVTPPPSSPNKPPTIVLPSSVPFVQRGVPTALADISVSDGDAVSLNQTITVTLKASTGTLSSSQTDGTVTGNGSSSLSIAGTLTQVNGDLAHLVVTASAPDTTGSIQVQASDGLDSASNLLGFVVSNLATLTVSVPSSVTAAAGTSTALHGLSIADPNPASPADSFAVVVSTDIGTLTAPTPTPQSPTKVASTSLGFVSGSLADINADLASITFSDPTSGTGSLRVSILATENGTIFSQAEKFVPVTVTAPSPTPPPKTPPTVITHPITPAKPSSGIDPLEAALIDTRSYLADNPDVARAGMDPAAHFTQFGWKEGRDPDPLFDVNYYLSHNPDIARAGIDPLLHYAQYGWKEGRDPSASFSTSGYLVANPDVKLAGMNPLQHYLTYGVAEGRSI